MLHEVHFRAEFNNKMVPILAFRIQRLPQVIHAYLSSLDPTITHYPETLVVMLAFGFTDESAGGQPAI